MILEAVACRANIGDDMLLLCQDYEMKALGRRMLRIQRLLQGRQRLYAPETLYPKREVLRRVCCHADPWKDATAIWRSQHQPTALKVTHVYLDQHHDSQFITIQAAAISNLLGLHAGDTNMANMQGQDAPLEVASRSMDMHIGEPLSLKGVATCLCWACSHSLAGHRLCSLGCLKLFRGYHLMWLKGTVQQKAIYM